MIDIKLKDWYLKWFELYREDGIREVTANKYLARHKSLCNDKIGEMDIKKITREDAQKYIERYGKNRSRLTVSGQLHSVRSCMRDAMHDGLIKMNPFANVKMVYKEQKFSFAEKKEMREKKQWLEVDEYEKLKNFLIHWLEASLRKEPFSFSGRKKGRSEVKAQTLMMIIFIGLKTGLRYSEVLGITIADIDYKKSKITVDKTWDYKKSARGGFLPTKNLASMRDVLIDSETIKLIKSYCEWQAKYKVITNEQTLFCEKGVRHYNSTINSVMKKVTETIGVEYVSFHKLRHTQASYLLAKGVSIQVVSKRLGHTDTNMVRKVYGHLLKETEEEANEQILKVL